MIWVLVLLTAAAVGIFLGIGAGALLASDWWSNRRREILRRRAARRDGYVSGDREVRDAG